MKQIYTFDCKLKELLYEYFEIIKEIQDFQSGFDLPVSLYSLEQNRINKHKEIEEYLELNCLEKDRLKNLFSNLDKVCILYSECDEYLLKTKRDIKFLTKYVLDFLTYKGWIYFSKEGGIIF